MLILSVEIFPYVVKDFNFYALVIFIYLTSCLWGVVWSRGGSRRKNGLSAFEKLFRHFRVFASLAKSLCAFENFCCAVY